MTSKKSPAKKTVKKNALNKAVPEEERLLFARIKKGDDAARSELLKKYSVWATNIARKYHALFPNIGIAELEAEGNRGLLEAVERFETSKGVKFSTYSWFWIIKNIQEYITSSINLIGVPAKVMSDLRMIINAMNEGIKKGKNPSLKDISKKLGLGEDDVNEMLWNKKNVSAPLSLDMYLDEEDRQEKLGDMVEDKKLDGIKKILDRMDDEKSISSLLAQLSPLEQKVLTLRFGFKNNKSLALSKVSRKLNISPSKTKDIEYVALIKLKRLLSAAHKDDESAD